MTHSDHHKKSNQSAVTIALIALIMTPLMCCGFPYSVLLLTAPTRWKYSFAKEYPVDSVKPDADRPWHREVRGLTVYHSLMGKNDYANNFYEYVAPREIEVTILADKEDNGFSVKLIEYSATSSTHGVLDSHDSSSLPHTFEFKSTNNIYRTAIWNSDRKVVTDLPSGEIITVQYTIEITRDIRTTTHTYSVIMTPESRKEDPFYWLPSV